MRNLPNLRVDKYRKRGEGHDGWFEFRRAGGKLFVQASTGLGWEHVSVSVDAERCPTWEEMAWIKDQFWGTEECVVQYHPPESVYVNCHPYVLHMWKPDGVELPVPPPELIGPME